MKQPTLTFPENFTWGASTASYQIEGAVEADGRGPSIWDMFCRKNGAVFDSHNGDVACDHYHRMEEDVGHMRRIGLRGYRFSIAWPRIFPEGTGPLNEPGLAFYDRLVDRLLEAGIQPWITLYHWDLPLALYHRGGWLNPDSPQWFADYVAAVAGRLGDRVNHWMTFNEPQIFVGHGLEKGIHAPGDQLALAEVLLAGKHILLAHGRACEVLRAKTTADDQQIGWAPAIGGLGPDDPENPASVEAAQEALFHVGNSPVSGVSWWSDPVVFGHFPADMPDNVRAAMPSISDADLATIHQPIDFFGINIYALWRRFRRHPEGWKEGLPRDLGLPYTHFDWPVTPDCLYWTPRFLFGRYKLPMVITENGMASHDWVSLDGKVHDPQRIDYLERHLSELRRAIAEGIDVRGYFQWSLMDNFEWAEGYRRRFGMIHIDYPTGHRTPKDSADWYGEVIRSNGANVNPRNLPVRFD